MRYNDLSNRTTPNILFRVDGTLVDFISGESYFKRLKDKLFKNTKVKENVLSLLVRAILNTDYSFTLIVSAKEWNLYNTGTKNKLLCIANLIIFNSLEELKVHIEDISYMYYIDDNMDKTSNKIMDLDDFEIIVKGR